MTAAFLAGIQDTEFTCSSGGFVAAPGANPILDDGGAGEVHGRIKIDTAFEVSCNQYFAQMGVKLGPNVSSKRRSCWVLELTTHPWKRCEVEKNRNSGTPALMLLRKHWRQGKLPS